MIENKYFKKTILELIPDQWGIDKIGNIFYIKTGKTNVQDSTQDGKYPLFDRSTRLKKSSKYLFDSEAIIVPGEGKEFIPRYFDGKFDLHQRAYALIPIDKNINVKFCYYWIYLDRAYLEKVSVGSTVKSLRLEHFYNFPIPLPSRKEQDSISVILSCLDSKIELNEKMNKTLETIAQAIFKHWFIDFEFPNEEGKPYKSSGGEMVDSELGKIPKGWKVRKFKDLGRIVCGKTPLTKDETNFGNDIPFITIPDMRGSVFTLETERYLSIKGADSQKSKFLPPLTVCVSCIATPGLVALTSAESQTNQQINSIICKKEISPFFAYFIAKEKTDEIIKKGMGGTATLNLNTSDFSNLKLILPNTSIISRFHVSIHLLFRKILLNSKGILKLTEIRDSLLPKLMTGKIRVPLEDKHE